MPIRISGLWSGGQDRQWRNDGTPGAEIIRSDDGPIAVGTTLWPSQTGPVRPVERGTPIVLPNGNEIIPLSAQAAFEQGLYLPDPDAGLQQIFREGSELRFEGPLTFDVDFFVEVERSGNGFVELDVTVTDASPGMGLTPGDSWSKSQRRKLDILTWSKNGISIPAGEFITVEVELITSDDVIRIVQWWAELSNVS